MIPTPLALALGPFGAISYQLSAAASSAMPARTRDTRRHAGPRTSPASARPSIEEIRTAKYTLYELATWYSVSKQEASAAKNEKDAAGGVGLGLIHRVILGPDGLGADIIRPQLNIFLSRIALPTARARAKV
jgi:hypothetical protein